VQRILTHKDFKTKQRYAPLYDQTMRNGVKNIDELLQNKESIIIENNSEQHDPNNIKNYLKNLTFFYFCGIIYS